MIIHFDNVNLSSRSGPNSFAKRLHKKLFQMGHSVTNSAVGADVSLVFIEPSGAKLAKKIVQRLDGIWFAPHEFEANNVKIKWLYERADHVILQSNFDMSMTTKWWGLPKKHSVIKNGIDNETSADVKLQENLDALRKRHEKIFVASANWHPQKRLQENIKLFTRLKKEFYPTACLIVMGSNAKAVGEDIYQTGNLEHDHCMQILRHSDWMLHLAWLDHCPNTVIEALSCKVPVICAEDGGTKELIQGYGLILNERVKYDFQLTNYDEPPDMKIENMQLNPLPTRSSLGPIPDVSIETAAKKYCEVFESVL